MIENETQLTKPNVPGLPENYESMLDELFEVWSTKIGRNRERENYYDAKNRLKDLGISIPPALKKIETVIGWPAKAVDALAVRSRFDGFTFPGDGADQLKALLDENNFDTTYAMATTSELKHSCSFLTVSKGAQDEPDVIINAYSAMTAAAIWDRRRKRIRCGMTVVDADNDGNPTAINLYTDDAVIELTSAGSVWGFVIKKHGQKRPLMEPLVYRPSLERPFGKSRISRAVMSIADSAVREALRTEVSAEFFTAPQKYMLGVDADVFGDKSKWEAYIGNWIALGNNEDGEAPTVGQFSQASMQPHSEYLRSLAAQFSGETCVPLSSLGVISDNPSSAEAIYAAREDLIIEAETLNDNNARSLRNIGRLVLAISQDKTIADLTDDERGIMPSFRNPARASIVSQSAAMVQQATVAPWIAETEVFLEELGYTEDQRIRMLSDKKRASATDTLSAIASMRTEPAEGDKTATGTGTDQAAS